MNTIPDDELLALWVDDALDGPAAAAVDAWASEQAEWIERRRQARQLAPLLRAALPADENPLYPEFFNHRIAREISRESARAARVPAATRPFRLWRWLMPATAVAGMMLCFWGGTRMAPVPVIAAPEPLAAVPMSFVYTPEKGVNAAYFTSEPADAMIIVLDGVAAIPDSFEIPESAAVREQERDIANIETAAP